MVDNSKKEFPQFSPAAYFGGNFILGGLSYVLLRQYKRFFVFLVLLLVSLFLPFGRIFLLIFSGIDAYIIAKHLKNKEIPIPEYNSTLTWIAIGIWIIGTLIALATIFLGVALLSQFTG